MKTEDVEYNTLKGVAKVLKRLCEKGMPKQNEDEKPGWFIEASIEDGLLKVQGMVKRRKHELKLQEAADAVEAILARSEDDSVADAIESLEFPFLPVQPAADCVAVVGSGAWTGTVTTPKPKSAEKLNKATLKTALKSMKNICGEGGL